MRNEEAVKKAAAPRYRALNKKENIEKRNKSSAEIISWERETGAGEGSVSHPQVKK